MGLEGAGGLGKRIKAVRKHLGDGAKFHRLLLPVDLSKRGGEEGVKLIIAKCKALERYYGEPVVAIGIDTLAQATAGDEMNDQSSMMPFFQKCNQITSATSAAVIVVAHPGKDATRGEAGSYSLRAAADFRLEVVWNEQERPAERILRATKNKEGAEGDILSFTLQQLVVGEDDEGEDITACVIDAKAVTSTTRKSRPPKPGTKAAEALNEFDHCILAGKGRRLFDQDGIPDGAIVVAHEDLVEACKARGFAHSDAEDPNEREKVERTAIRRGINGAVTSGHLARHMHGEGLVYWRPAREKFSDFNAGSMGSSGVNEGSTEFDPHQDAVESQDRDPRTSGVNWGQDEKPNKIKAGSSGVKQGSNNDLTPRPGRGAAGSAGGLPLRGKTTQAITRADAASSDETGRPGGAGDE